MITSGIVFERRGNGLRLAVFGPVEYWLADMVTLDDSMEVAMTARVGTHHRRLGRWDQASKAHDETHARTLIRKSHEQLLALTKVSEVA